MLIQLQYQLMNHLLNKLRLAVCLWH